MDLKTQQIWLFHLTPTSSIIPYQRRASTARRRVCYRAVSFSRRSTTCHLSPSRHVIRWFGYDITVPFAGYWFMLPYTTMRDVLRGAAVIAVTFATCYRRSRRSDGRAT